MKKFQLVLFVFFCLNVFGSINQAYAQKVYFCEGVDDYGYPINESTTFTIPEDGGYLYVLIRLPNKVNCRTVKLIIYNELLTYSLKHFIILQPFSFYQNKITTINIKFTNVFFLLLYNSY